MSFKRIFTSEVQFAIRKHCTYFQRNQRLNIISLEIKYILIYDLSTRPLDHCPTVSYHSTLTE